MVRQRREQRFVESIARNLPTELTFAYLKKENYKRLIYNVTKGKLLQEIFITKQEIFVNSNSLL